MTTKTKSSQTPTFSIICPCFNHEKYVSDFINSVLEQTYEDFELIIIDDCSEDDSVKIIKSFNDKRIKLIQHEYNKGINAVINTDVFISYHLDILSTNCSTLRFLSAVSKLSILSEKAPAISSSIS